jgi:hypothetical protein
MRPVLLFVVVAGASLSGKLTGEEPVPSPADVLQNKNSQEVDAERKRRGEFMKAQLDRYTIVAADRLESPLLLAEEPALRYSNPVRNFFSDGGLFLWLDGKRPLAAAVVSIRGKGQVFGEFTSLTAKPLECRREGAIVWSPRAGNVVGQSLSDAPPPSPSDKVRLRQMRDLARRFRAVKQASSNVELRLMTQPIYRFSAESDGIVDGALFAFVEATDPEFLLLIEGHRADAASPAEWLYSLARITSPPLEVELDGRQLWSASGYWSHARSPTDPYSEMPLGAYLPP